MLFLTISTTDNYNHNPYLLLITFIDFFDADNYFKPISTFVVVKKYTLFSKCLLNSKYPQALKEINTAVS